MFNETDTEATKNLRCVYCGTVEKSDNEELIKFFSILASIAFPIIYTSIFENLIVADLVNAQ